MSRSMRSRPVHAVTDTRPGDPADHEREELVHDVVIERPAAASRVSPAGEHRPVDLEIAIPGERFGDVHDHEVGEQEFGQRILGLIGQRPVGLAFQAVVGGQGK
jgi:hypothetical protein